MNDEFQSARLIPDFDAAKVSKWFEELKDSIAKKKPHFLQFYPDSQGGKLFTSGDNNNGYYYLQVRDEIVYFVRYRKVNASGNSFGRQLLVARRNNSPFAAGVALHVFYRHLLPRFKALISDTTQTQHGKSFWDYAIAAAFHRGMHVYFFDRRSNPNSLLEMTSLASVDDYSRAIWGHDKGHERTHAVISLTSLAIIPKQPGLNR